MAISSKPTSGPGTAAQRILSSTLGTEPFGKFSTLLDSSAAYKHSDFPPS